MLWSFASTSSSVARRGVWSLSASRSSSFSTSTSLPPLKLAIVGAGPSGLYSASRILSQLHEDDTTSQVHVYERLPAPHGLVRYGVAPDHPEVKNVQHKFDLLEKDPRFSFFGNVAIGSPSTQDSDAASSPSPYSYPSAIKLPLESLIPHYSHLLLSYGSSLSAPLPHTPGSSSSDRPLSNVQPALAFVSWYNGHPAFVHLKPDLSKIKHVTVIGQGNVALDVARILLKDVDALSSTDLPESVLQVLRESAVETVEVVGRRGPAQVAFTTKEFREMLALPGVRYEGPSKETLKESLEEVARVGGSEERMRKRLIGLMEKGSTTKPPEDGKKEKTFKLSFLRSPKAFLSDSHPYADAAPVSKVQWKLNALLPPPTAAPTTPDATPNLSDSSAPVSMAVATDEELETASDMIIESVGYRSEPLETGDDLKWGSWFDERKGKVKNVGGRVVSEDGQIVPNVYASGWLARGPTGVIATTMYDSYSVADLLLSDRQSAPSSLAHTPMEGVPDAVADGQAVSWGQWKAVEREEARLGEEKGKKTEKFVDVDAMLEVAQKPLRVDQ